MSADIQLDFDRRQRIGLDEAIFCAGKSVAQIVAILKKAASVRASLLLTRLSQEKLEALPSVYREALDHCAISQTAFFGEPQAIHRRGDVAIVAAGTSDAPVAREALRTLRYRGHEAELIVDVGVAGLWRLTQRLEEIKRHPILIVVAGMDAAMASVLGGLVGGAIICVPTSVGYGAAEGGRTALNAMLASCAPGLLVCNIDNGYGAAAAALRLIAASDRLHRAAGGEQAVQHLGKGP
jgi:pyridinium-3,5-biscarboxylic acid mononucleotide synthase